MPSIVFLAPKELVHTQKYRFYSSKDAKLNVPPDITYWDTPLKAGSPILELRANKPIQSVSGQINFIGVTAIETCQGQLPVVDVLSQLTGYTELVVSQFRSQFK